MKRPAFLALIVLPVMLATAAEPPAAIAPSAPAFVDRLRSAIARTVYEEYVYDTTASADEQVAEFAGLEKNTTKLSAEQARQELALLETMTLTRDQISDSRRAVLACSQLSREEAELLLGELARVKARWDKLLAEEVPARKAALVRQIEIAAVAVMAPPTPAAPPVRTAAEILRAASRQVRPSGIALIGGEYHLLLDGQRVKAGQTLTVKLEREYKVTLTSVSRNAFTLSLDGENLLVPME